jgi:hypothetical protein
MSVVLIQIIYIYGYYSMSTVAENHNGSNYGLSK